MVRLERIGKRGADGTPILSEVSLALEAGEFYCLTGAAGAGKTTLLDIVALAQRPSDGRLFLFERDLAGLGRAARAALRRRIGFVFQEPRLIEHLTARANLALPLRIAGAPQPRIDRDVGELLDWLGLTERAETPAEALSGGERRRIAIARAVVANPELLIIDEPTGDAVTADLLLRLCRQVNRLGTTVLIATRDVAFAAGFDHRRFHLEDGMLAQAGMAA